MRQGAQTSRPKQGTMQVADRYLHALEKKCKTLEAERDEARSYARLLAHAYEHDVRPPSNVVKKSLLYPLNLKT